MLSKAHYGHAIVHHGKTFRTDHVTQFQGADEQASLDRELTESGHASFVALRYGLITNFLGSLNYAGGPIAVSLGLSFLIYGRVHPSFLAGACLPIVTTPALSIYIHPYLHLPRHLAHSSAPILVSWILRSAYGDWARRHHYVHHRQPSVNFNLLPGGDYLFGTYRKATDDELVDMRKIGLLE
ncbi:MAG: hypothetical protein IT423_22170 [Pirellulaceae bacterium]|nr:hypothetical protein [Pirellulaceae bacterium]